MNDKIHSDYFLKQVIFKNETEIEERQDLMEEAMKRLYPKGCYVFFERGRGVWQGTVIAHGRGQFSDNITVRTPTGGTHHVYHKKIVEKQDKGGKA